MWKEDANIAAIVWIPQANLDQYLELIDGNCLTTLDSTLAVKDQGKMAKRALSICIMAIQETYKLANELGIPELTEAIARGDVKFEFHPTTGKLRLVLGQYPIYMEYSTTWFSYNRKQAYRVIRNVLKKFAADLQTCLEHPVLRTNAPVHFVLTDTQEERAAAQTFITSYWEGKPVITLGHLLKQDGTLIQQHLPFTGPNKASADEAITRRLNQLREEAQQKITFSHDLPMIEENEPLCTSILYHWVQARTEQLRAHRLIPDISEL